jgi:hypothetical protein
VGLQLFIGYAHVIAKRVIARSLYYEMALAWTQ